MKKKNFSEIQKKKTRQEFRVYIKQIAEHYALTDYEYAATYFTEHYGITENCYHKLLDKAIAWNIVDDKICSAIEQKRSYWAREHSGTSVQTKLKHERLLAEREQFKKFPFTKKEVKDIAVRFIKKDATKQNLADEYNTTTRDIDVVLYVACINNLIDDVLFRKLKEQSLKHDSSLKAAQVFLNLERRRRENK